MTESFSPRATFENQIAEHMAAEKVSPEIKRISMPRSLVEVRNRGAFLLNCELSSETSSERVSVLYSDNDHSAAKLSASHVMMPAGPYDGIGGQHGYPRWTDYEAIASSTGEKEILTLKAAQSGAEPNLTKTMYLSDDELMSRTEASNGTDVDQQTSIGEHYYFSLQNEIFEGMRVDKMPFNDHFGESALEKLQAGEVLILDSFESLEIHFPAGHDIRLSAQFEGETSIPVGLWVWHRQGTPSVCFEPVVGVANGGNQGVSLEPGSQAALTTTIELL